MLKLIHDPPPPQFAEVGAGLLYRLGAVFLVLWEVLIYEGNIRGEHGMENEPVLLIDATSTGCPM